MSEMWRQLLTGDSRRLTDCLDLGVVKLSRQTGGMEIKFNAARLLTASEERQVDAAMKSGFPGREVTVRVNYPALRKQAQQDIAKFKSIILGRVLEQSPACRGFLSARETVWTLEEDVLTVDVYSAAGVDFLKYKKVDELIRDSVKELFGLRVGVNIKHGGGERELMERISEKHRLEEEELARSIRENEAGAPETPKVSNEAILGNPFTGEALGMKDITDDAGKIIVLGEIISEELRDTKKEDCKILSLNVSDYTSTISAKAFVKPRRGKNAPSFQDMLKKVRDFVKPGAWVKLQGEYRYDEFDRRFELMISSMLPATKPRRTDRAREKRVELHLHTTMSAMDACASPTDLINQAAQWGHKAIAITDHGVVQAFPEAFGAAKKAGIKLIPGCEAYLINDSPEVVAGADDRPLSECAYVVFDVETTGLNTHTDKITEIGAVRVEGGREVARFSRLIDPGMPIPEKVTELTGITNTMVRGQPTIEETIGEFDAFCKGAVLVAHNASFDTAFFRRAYEEAGMEYTYPVLDTLVLCRNYYRSMKTHKLGQICKELGIDLRNAHRAVNDAAATAQVLLKTLASLRREKKVELLSDLNSCFAIDAGGDSHHIVLLATSREGMTNLNRMISDSHLKYFHRTPRMPRSLIQRWRKDILVGSACEAGELYRAVAAGRSDRELEQIASFYDYLEIQPLGNNEFMIRKGMVSSKEDLKDFNRKILALGRKLGKPVVATGDVHFKDPQDSIYRTILMTAKGFDDADFQPPLYFRTTDEMLKEFEYLGKEDARYVVVEAPNEIADRVEHIKDLFMKAPDGGDTFQPFWEDAEQNLRQLCKDTAERIFGSPLPDIVQARIDKELGAICGYGFSTLYMIAVKLVKKSLSDGYIVGSRGSVGSSFVAKLAGITEVDALPPYYVCPKCKHYEFDVPKQYTCGLDLPAKNCPVCGTIMNKDGFNIPFEVFLGFKGDKVPDIDLNFSGVYQPVAHQYVKEL
ncbi:MAG: PolC-type DNA polymerase III, partial [Clostridia bacterium]|nr:PolC-type DNA polymerase III [Clostridia bacterium]